MIDCAGKGNIPLFAEICNACEIPYVVVHDRDAPRGAQPAEAERIANDAILRIAGKRRTITARARLRGRDGPARAPRQARGRLASALQAGNGEVPGAAAAGRRARRRGRAAGRRGRRRGALSYHGS